MSNTNIALLFMTCDSYSDTWFSYFSCLKKHWPEFSMPIYICSESKGLTLPGYNISYPLEGTSGNELWSKRLLKTLKKIKEDYILFTLEDFWLTDRVDDNQVNDVIETIQRDNSIGYICMINEKKPFSERKSAYKNWVKDCEYPILWECTKECGWRLTTQMGVWRKEYLIKMLRAHESAWSFETLATWRSSRYSKKRVFDTKHTIFKYPEGGVISRGLVREKCIDIYNPDLLSKCIAKRGVLRDTDPLPNTSAGTPTKNLKYYINVIKSYSPKLF